MTAVRDFRALLVSHVLETGHFVFREASSTNGYLPDKATIRARLLANPRAFPFAVLHARGEQQFEQKAQRNGEVLSTQSDCQPLNVLLQINHDSSCPPSSFEKVWMGPMRLNLYRLLENPRSSFGAKVVSIVSAFFVLLSLLGTLLVAYKI